jgi:hypothetical protein
VHLFGEIATSERFSGATVHNGFSVRERIAQMFRSDLTTAPQSFQLMPNHSFGNICRAVSSSPVVSGKSSHFNVTRGSAILTGVFSCFPTEELGLNDNVSKLYSGRTWSACRSGTGIFQCQWFSFLPARKFMDSTMPASIPVDYSPTFLQFYNTFFVV